MKGEMMLKVFTTDGKVYYTGRNLWEVLDMIQEQKRLQYALSILVWESKEMKTNATSVLVSSIDRERTISEFPEIINLINASTPRGCYE